MVTSGEIREMCVVPEGMAIALIRGDSFPFVFSNLQQHQDADAILGISVFWSLGTFLPFLLAKRWIAETIPLLETGQLRLADVENG